MAKRSSDDAPQVSFTTTARRTVSAGLARQWRFILGSVAVVILGVGTVLVLGAVGVLSIPFIVENWNTLLRPALLSVSLTSAAFLLGFLGAIPLALLRAYTPRKSQSPRGHKPPPRQEARAHRAPVAPGGVHRSTGVRRAVFAPVRGAATGYVDGIRGTPFFVQLFIVFFFMLLVIPTNPQVFIIAGLVALTLNTVGYQAEVLRAGFQSVGQGQVDAGKAIGMRGRQVFAYVTLPQALRLIILPLTNEWISLFKASTLLAFIAVPELFSQATSLAVNKGHPLDAFVMIAAVYLIIIIPLSRAVTYIERKTRIPGLGVPGAVPERKRIGGRVPTPAP